MSFAELENQNPHIYHTTEERTATQEEEDDNIVDEFDRREIFGTYFQFFFFSFIKNCHVVP